MNIDNLNTATAQGSNGRFTGLVSDKAVFGAFAENGKWSEDVTHFFGQWFDEWLRQGKKGTYLDIGANIGLTLVPLAGHAAVACSVAIEADPINAALLRHNVQQNQIASCQVIEAAVFDRHDTLEFERDDTNAGDHRVRQSPRGDALTMMGEKARQVVQVKAAPLDDLIDVDGPLAIKVDIQGAEPALFRGGARIVAQAEVMLIEYWPYGMARMGEDEQAFRADVARHFSHGALIWPHAPTDPPDWQPLPEIYKQIDAVFGGGDTELHKIGCLNLALKR